MTGATVEASEFDCDGLLVTRGNPKESRKYHAPLAARISPAATVNQSPLPIPCGLLSSGAASPRSEFPKTAALGLCLGALAGFLGVVVAAGSCEDAEASAFTACELSESSAESIA